MSKSSLKKLLQQLDTAHAHRFDPARFAFIQSLSKRLDRPPLINNKVFSKRVFSIVQAYHKDLHSKRLKAKKTLRKLISEFPNTADRATSLFEHCEFRQLEKLNSQLRSDAERSNALAELRSLSRAINARANGDKVDTEPLSFDEMLQRQEYDIRGASSVSNQLEAEAADGRIELQSMKLFKESMRHHTIDKVIDRALKTLPTNPGPHNPHMLVVNAMTRIHDLSPQYLRRFSTYVETLLWLEKNANRVDDSKSLSKE